MRLCEEAAEVDKFAVCLVVDVDDTPAVLTGTALTTVDDHAVLGANHSEGNEALSRELARHIHGRDATMSIP